LRARFFRKSKGKVQFKQRKGSEKAKKRFRRDIGTEGQGG
jgi:hypothetical protein